MIFVDWLLVPGPPETLCMHNCTELISAQQESYEKGPIIIPIL
jgi:hypothetical protein